MDTAIKFRAWNEINGGWLPNEIVEKWELRVLQEHINFVQQFTGLKDKNGKEIYFDDIIKFKFKDEEGDGSQFGTALITKTMNGGAGIMYDFTGEDLFDGEEVFAVSEGGEITDIWEDKDMWEVEVIGNIHENPELIKNNG